MFVPLSRLKGSTNFHEISLFHSSEYNLHYKSVVFRINFSSTEIIRLIQFVQFLKF